MGALIWLATIGVAAQTPEARAVLQKRCFACHGPAMQMNGLRLDDGEAALKGGYSGPSILPGNAAGSALIDRVVSTKEGYAMPPAGPKLTEAEVAILKAWIDQGAKYPGGPVAKAAPAKPQLWSLQPLRRPDPPAVKNAAWVRNPIDAFVLAKLESKGLSPSPETSKETLARRASLDLLGLPPSPQELGDFLADTRPDAYERYVDRLLHSPHFGERWARHWLDLARYADSDGYEKDLVRPYAWRWRNWVIDAYNADMPFDRFTIQQIAGDLLPDADTNSRVATGFHRNVLVNREAGVSRAEDRFEQTVNRTNTIATTWLGLTVGCAQCHDHKYDPISQREFYQMFAFMDAVTEETIDAPLPGELGPWLAAAERYRAEREKILREYEVSKYQTTWEDQLRKGIEDPGKDLELDFAVTEVTAGLDHAQRILKTPAGRRSQRDADSLTDHFLRRANLIFKRDKAVVDRMNEARKKIEELNASTPFVAQAYVIREMPEPVVTRIAVRGDYRRPGVTVEPGVPAALPPLHRAPGEPPRLTFAKWLVSPENPLTARVIANRYWQEFFGKGLVRTSEDFGTQGEKPTHPELLDWLATEFMANGWSQKQLFRTIVTSATYRQSSRVRPELREIDPDNSLLARQSRLRLSAEAIRDNALAAAGLLERGIGGPSIKPPQPKGVAELTYANSNKWVETEGPARYRRGLYIHFQRTAPYPQLMNFDAPEATVACSRRRVSNTPLQSLNLMNDPVFLEAAQALAYRASSTADPVASAFEWTLARKPTDRERARLEKLRDEEDLVAVCRVLLNLDETITRE
jgi:mono/diheme cytochrome c family protein